MARISNARLLSETPQTLEQLLRKASNHLWGKTPRYQRHCESTILEAQDLLGRPTLDQINTSLMDGYVAIMSKAVSPATVNRKLSVINVMLKYAYDREWIEKMPKLQWQKEDNERIRWLTPEEETKLLSLLPPDVSAFCEILIHTGMRRGELMSLTKEQVNGDYVRLWKTKTNKARSVPLSDRAKELVDQWVPFDISEKRLVLEWAKARKAMGMEDDPHFVLHMLRHTTATRMLDTTGNIAVVQKMLGHSQIATTMRYAHIADEGLLDAVRLTSKRFAEPALNA